MTLEQKISALFDSIDRLVNDLAELSKHHPEVQQEVLAIMLRHKASLDLVKS